MVRKRIPVQYVVCLSNRGYRESLVVRRIYRSVTGPYAVKRNLVRVIDESGEEYLYPASMFAAIEVPPKVAKLFKKSR